MSFSHFCLSGSLCQPSGKVNEQLGWGQPTRQGKGNFKITSKHKFLLNHGHEIQFHFSVLYLNSS